MTLGSLLRRRNQNEQGVRELEEAARLAPQDISVRLILAAGYTELRRWSEAERELRFIEEVRPGLPQVDEVRARIARLKKGQDA